MNVAFIPTSMYIYIFIWTTLTITINIEQGLTYSV